MTLLLSLSLLVPTTAASDRSEEFRAYGDDVGITATLDESGVYLEMTYDDRTTVQVSMLNGPFRDYERDDAGILVESMLDHIIENAASFRVDGLDLEVDLDDKERERDVPDGLGGGVGDDMAAWENQDAGAGTGEDWCLDLTNFTQLLSGSWMTLPDADAAPADVSGAAEGGGGGVQVDKYVDDQGKKITITKTKLPGGGWTETTQGVENRENDKGEPVKTTETESGTYNSDGELIDQSYNVTEATYHPDGSVTEVKIGTEQELQDDGTIEKNEWNETTTKDSSGAIISHSGSSKTTHKDQTGKTIGTSSSTTGLSDDGMMTKTPGASTGTLKPSTVAPPPTKEKEKEKEEPFKPNVWLPSEDNPYSGPGICLPDEMMSALVNWNILGEAVTDPSPIEDEEIVDDEHSGSPPIDPPGTDYVLTLSAEYLQPNVQDFVTDPPRD